MFKTEFPPDYRSDSDSEYESITDHDAFKKECYDYADKVATPRNIDDLIAENDKWWKFYEMRFNRNNKEIHYDNNMKFRYRRERYLQIKEEYKAGKPFKPATPTKPAFPMQTETAQQTTTPEIEVEPMDIPTTPSVFTSVNNDTETQAQTTSVTNKSESLDLSEKRRKRKKKKPNPSVNTETQANISSADDPASNTQYTAPIPTVETASSEIVENTVPVQSTDSTSTKHGLPAE